MSESVPVALAYHHRSNVHDIWLDLRAYPTEEGLAVFHRNIAARERAEGQARHNAESFRPIGDTIPDLIIMKDRESRMTYGDPAPLSAAGQSWGWVAGQTDAEWASDPAESAAVLAADRRVMDGDCTEAVEKVSTASQGRRVFLSTRAPTCASDGTIPDLAEVSTGVTERNREEELRILLIHELNHRVKNTLATVQGIVQQALRGADPVLRRAFEARLTTLSAAHDVLTRESWESAGLRDVVGTVQRAEASLGRRPVRGPALRLRTSAAKYGASPGPTGQASLDWTVTGQEDGRRLSLGWRERGDPVVTPPTQHGVESRLFERALAQELRILFEPERVTCTVDAPLPPEWAELRETAT